MCEHCHEEEYNAVILNLEDQDLECGVITIFEMDGQKLLQDMKKLSILRDAIRHLHFPCSISKSCIRK